MPYSALPAELTHDYDERTRLMTWRVAILAVAILVSGGLSPVVREHFGYAGVGVFVGVLLAIGVVGSWHGTGKVPPARATVTEGSFLDQLRIVSSSKPFRMLATTFVIQAFATSIMLASVDYVARTVLGDESISTILFVCFVGPALLVTPIWQWLGGRTDKRSGYVLSSLLLVAGALLTWAGMGAGTGFVAAGIAVVGVGYAGVQMFPMAMIPDVAADDAQRSGQNRVGVFTGVWTAGETLGLALGPFGFAAVLAMGGYVSSTDGAVAQPDSAVTAIQLGAMVLPAVLMLVSLVFLLRYRLAPRRG